MTDSQPPERQVMHGEVVGYQPPPYQGSVIGTDSGAITALSLAIASWVVIPVVGAIAALIIAPGAKRRIKAANGALGGTAIVTAAQVVSVLNLLAVAVLAALIVAAIQLIL